MLNGNIPIPGIFFLSQQSAPLGTVDHSELEIPMRGMHFRLKELVPERRRYI
jgi:hypothetical protein